mmetsp:Transcript_9212/g.23487  ORF Transcript_9212/g.23487 Transcript_9212/m.23487 type:complete len:164 (+) Transcript_9212:3-494(+)
MMQQGLGACHPARRSMASAEEDRWDDSAIVEAFNRAVQTHDGGPCESAQSVTSAKAFSAAGASPDEARDSPLTAADARDAAPDLTWRSVEAENRDGATQPPQQQQGAPPRGLPSSAPPQLPPIPAAENLRQEDLAALLSAWYYAGYQTGRFEALYGPPQQGAP